MHLYDDIGDASSPFEGRHLFVIFFIRILFFFSGIGIVLHYLSSCVLLWIIVSVTNLYKKVTKALRPPLLNDDPPPDVPLPPKPMFRFYLVGWGVALILCGISVALNLQQYASYHYCFLAWTPSLGAFYTPCVVLVSILSVFCLLTHCMIKSAGPGSYSEAPANTETTELELLDAASPNSDLPPTTSHSGHTASHLQSERLNDDEISLASQSSDSLYDSHHSPLTQLRAHEVTLILFVLTWAAAAITTAAPFEAVIPYHATIFSVVYAACASSLGVFVFLFFCFGRSDVKEAWRSCDWRQMWPRKGAQRGILQQTAANNASSTGSGSSGTHLIHVSSTNASRVPTSLTAVSVAPNNASVVHSVGPTNNSVNVAQSVHSLNSSSHSPTNKSSTVSHNNIMTSPSKADSNVLKNDMLRQPGPSLHLFSLGPENHQYSPEMFYNPKQAGVAKRFFQKQRLKQMVKQNNLGLNQDNDSDCNSSVFYKPRPARSNNNSGMLILYALTRRIRPVLPKFQF